MIEQIGDLANSRNVALVLSLIANVLMIYVIRRLFAKIEESVSSKDQLANKIISDYLEEKKRDAKGQAPD